MKQNILAKLNQTQSKNKDNYEQDDIEKYQLYFTENEIKESFKTLDINSKEYITANDLRIYLDLLGENVTKEEIDEMIRICDINENGRVYFQQFQKLISGNSLAPIGQAYPPNFVIEKNKNYPQAGSQEVQNIINSQQKMNYSDHQNNQSNRDKKIPKKELIDFLRTNNINKNDIMRLVKIEFQKLKKIEKKYCDFNNFIEILKIKKGYDDNISFFNSLLEDSSKKKTLDLKQYQKQKLFFCHVNWHD